MQTDNVTSRNTLEDLPQAPKGRKPYVTWVVNHSVTDELHATARLEPARELQKLGWRVTVIAPSRRRERPDDDLDIRPLYTPKVYLLGKLVFHLQATWMLLRQWRVLDVILFHQPSLFWLSPLRAIRFVTRRKRPFFVMDTRTVPMTASTRRARLYARFHNLMNALGNHLVDGQTAITTRMAESVHIPSAQLLGVWPSGVTVETFAPACTQRRWPQPQEPIELIYVGVLYAERNLMALCRAVVAANAAGRAFRLTIVGRGPQRVDLEKFAAQHAPALRVLPAVPHNEVPALLAAAHVGVLPFPDEEKFLVSSPIKLFEYMAAGLAILATEIACHTDVIGDAPIVFWAGTGDEESLRLALQQCHADRASLATMGCASAVMANDWSWAASAKKLSAALMQPLGADISHVSMHSKSNRESGTKQQSTPA